MNLNWRDAREELPDPDKHCLLVVEMWGLITEIYTGFYCGLPIDEWVVNNTPDREIPRVIYWCYKTDIKLPNNHKFTFAEE